MQHMALLPRPPHCGAAHLSIGQASRHRGIEASRHRDEGSEGSESSRHASRTKIGSTSAPTKETPPGMDTPQLERSGSRSARSEANTPLWHLRLLAGLRRASESTNRKTEKSRKKRKRCKAALSSSTLAWARRPSGHGPHSAQCL